MLLPLTRMSLHSGAAHTRQSWAVSRRLSQPHPRRGALILPASVLTPSSTFQLTAFGGFLKYTVSYDIPVETVDGDLMSHADVVIKVLAFTLLCYGAEELREVTVFWHEMANKWGPSSKELTAKWPFSSDSPPQDTKSPSVRILSLGPFLELLQGSTCHSSLDPHSWAVLSRFKGRWVFVLTQIFQALQVPLPILPHCLPTSMIRQQCLMWGQETRCYSCPQSSPFVSLVSFSSPPISSVTKRPRLASPGRVPGVVRNHSRFLSAVSALRLCLLRCPVPPSSTHRHRKLRARCTFCEQPFLIFNRKFHSNCKKS